MKQPSIQQYSPLFDDIQKAVSCLEQGAVIGIPTETFYGLAADPYNEQALKRLFAIKQRPHRKPILLIISRLEQLSDFVQTIPSIYQTLIDSYWPGPLTLVFPAREDVSPLLTGDSGTIGIRLTPHPVTARIIEQFGKPVTATSANISQQEPARTAQQVIEYMGGKVPYVVDGGPASPGPGSTVVNFKNGHLCIERLGRIQLPGLGNCA